MPTILPVMRGFGLGRWGAVIGFGLGLLVAGTIGAVLVGLGCDENLQPGTARGDVCAHVGEPGGARSWLLAWAPALVFVTTATLRPRRKQLAGLAGVIFAALVALHALVIAIVTSNLLA